MPTLFEIFGMRFFFYSLEHLPIHVHVENGDGRAKIDVKTLEIIENHGMKPRDLKKKYHGKHISKPKKGIDCHIEFF